MFNKCHTCRNGSTNEGNNHCIILEIYPVMIYDLYTIIKEESIMEMSLRKMGLFQLTVCHLISTGKTETITDIETHICNENVVEYLIEKYNDSFFYLQIVFD